MWLSKPIWLPVVTRSLDLMQGKMQACAAEAEEGRGTSLVPPFGGAPKLEQEPVPSARLVRSAVSRAFLFLLTLCTNANSSTAFKVFVFKSKEGRRRKRRAQPSQACVGGLGLIETPPAKRLESPSSPSPRFSCLLQAPKGASIRGDALLLGEGLWAQGQRARRPRSTGAMHPAPLRVLRHQTSLTPLP